MQALSIRQPWAHLIVRGHKKGEIRSWSTPYRGRLAIHASSTKPTGVDLESIYNGEQALIDALSEVGSPEALPRGAIVGFVDLVDCVTGRQASRRLTKEERVLTGGYGADDCVWLLANPQEIRPVPIDGRLRLWEVPEPQRSAVEVAVREPAPRNSLGGSAYVTVVVPSRELAAVIGDKPVARSDVARLLWAYIERHGLQDQDDRRLIHADRRLQKVFGGQLAVSMLEMTRFVGQHLHADGVTP